MNLASRTSITRAFPCRAVVTVARGMFVIASLALCLLLMVKSLYRNHQQQDMAVPSSAHLLASAEPVANISENILHEFHTLLERARSRLGVLDESRFFVMLPHVVVGANFSELSKQSTVSMATQTSFDRLYELVDLMSLWRGPLSVAVFVVGEQFELSLAFVALLRVCDAALWSRCSFSFVHPFDQTPFSASTRLDQVEMLNCSALREAHTTLTSALSSSSLAPSPTRPYPQNHLRNLARKTCRTRHVYLVDVDTLPLPDMFARLSDFMRSDQARQCSKCVFVVPAYEISNDVELPRNAIKLIELVRRGKAQPFHQRVFVNNQKATNSARWEKLAVLSNETRIAYTIRYQYLYEPFFIADDRVPAHDTRFVGYGFTRNSQVYEMMAAGYKMRVLAPVFSVHRGLQNIKKYPKWRRTQIAANARKFSVFKKELLARYNMSRNVDQ